MSTEVENLSSILSNPVAPVVEAKPEVAPEPVKTEPEAKPEVKADTQRDEQGRFKSEKEEKQPLKPADVAAIIDERRRRQAAEQRLKDLEGQKPKADVWSDPEAVIAERVQAATSPMEAKFFNLSMKSARQGREDFDQVAEAFLKASEADPDLVKQMRAHDDPGEFVYQFGKHHMELSDVGGDLTKYRQKLTAEMDAKLTERDKTISVMKAELDALKQAQVNLSSVPRSLNTTSSVSTPVSGEDPEDIKNLVRFGNKR